MNGVRVGDFVGLEDHRTFGYVIHDRGGHVGRWQVRCLDGKIIHASSRDLRPITKKEMHPNCRCSTVYINEMTADQKIDLLLDYLGLRIDSEPRVIDLSDEQEGDDE